MRGGARGLQDPMDERWIRERMPWRGTATKVGEEYGRRPGRRDERGSRRDEVTVHMWVGKSVRCIGRKIRSITVFNNLYL